MSIERARSYFQQFGMEGRILEFPVSSATVELAAEALGVQSARIAKTLSFATADGCMLILFAGDARVDNHKFKERFAAKAKMLPAEQVEALTGHAVGGVCPFGAPENVPVYLDESLRRFYTVFPAAGSANSAIELSIPELYRHAHASGFVDVGKDWEGDYLPAFDATLREDVSLSDGEISLVLRETKPADERTGYVPAYHFDIVRASDGAAAGKCDLRVGYCRGVYFGGNIGYEVFPAFRGNRYAEKACRLLFQLSGAHGMPTVIISCQPDNLPSRRTLERLNGTFLGEKTVPADTELYRLGHRSECLFRYKPSAY